MDKHQIISAIQTQEFPAFVAALEGKYGEAFIKKNFAAMGLVAEGDKEGMFDTFGFGNNVNLFRIAHSAIRALGKAEMIAAGSDHSTKAEMVAVMKVIRTIDVMIKKDMGREGIPDAIFSGFMKNKESPKDNEPG